MIIMNLFRKFQKTFFILFLFGLSFNGLALGEFLPCAENSSCEIDGKVGIGTNNLSTGRLVVKQSSDGRDQGVSIVDSTGITRSLRLWIKGANSIIDSGGTGTGNLILNAGGGKIGIGTTTPNHKLTVKGTIHAKEIIVDTNVADYVFNDNYKLKSLKETEEFIKENNHLPGIPSDKDVKLNGVSLGAMQEKLLVKIEELTLHLIKLNKENIELQRKIIKMEDTIAKLNRIYLESKRPTGNALF